MPLVHQFNPHNNVTVEKYPLYQGFFSLSRYTVQYSLFAGGQSEKIQREVFQRHPAAAVLLYDPQLDRVVLIEQFRVGALDYGKHPWLFELVAGILENNESPEQVAHREAQEEAGCKIKKLIPICEYLVSPGACNEKVFLYCGIVDASNAGGLHGLKEEHEDIKVHVVKSVDAYECIAKGIIDNAAAIIALQWLQLNKQKIK